jgi:hypothetical protein
MIDQLILTIGSKQILFTLTEDALLISEAVYHEKHVCFKQRLKIQPGAWSPQDIYPLSEHEDELRLLRWLEMHLAERRKAQLEEAN